MGGYCLMEKIDYGKIIKLLVEEYPHDMEKFEKVINDSESHYGVCSALSFDTIINSDIWNADEKTILIRLFGYSNCDHELSYFNEDSNKVTMLAKHTIKYDNLTGFEALMRTFKDIKEHFNYNSKDYVYRDILETINDSAKEDLVSKYMEIALNVLAEEDLKRLIKPYYEARRISSVHNKSIINNIIRTKDLRLIKKYISYVDDVNLYISTAVETGDIGIVRYFLEDLDVDINYYPDEVILRELPALKMAIRNNDFEMVKFLGEHNVDFNLRANEDNFVENLINSKIKVFYMDPYIQGGAKNISNENILRLKYLRESSPLEYASKLDDNYIDNKFSDKCYVNFKGNIDVKPQSLVINFDCISDDIINRGKIVDFIFDKLNDKTNVNFTDLIAMSFITRDVNRFNKYSNYAMDNVCFIDFDYLFDLYFSFRIDSIKEMTVPFLNLLSKYSSGGLLASNFFDVYLNKRLNGELGFQFNKFNRLVFNYIPEQTKKDKCLVPYCRDIFTLNELLDLDFDINQIDDMGRNILFNLFFNLKKLISENDISEKEILLFDYLVDEMDLSLKDKDGKNVLYYALENIGGDYRRSKYYDFLNEKEVCPRYKSIVVRLIRKMDSRDICDESIVQLLESKVANWDKPYGIMARYVYRYYKELFEALMDKGFVLSDKLLDEIFRGFYSNLDFYRTGIGMLSDGKISDGAKVQSDNELDFLYEKLDKNTKIQKCNIDLECKKIFSNRDINFEEYKDMLINFRCQINSLKTFYSENIIKKYNPVKYLEYVKDKYHTIYFNLDNYLLKLIIMGLRRFGNDKIDDILRLCPDFNINSCLYKESIEMSYYDHLADIMEFDSDGNEIDGERFEASKLEVRGDDEILFTGGLMQYAILDNDMNLVKNLRLRGANLELVIYNDDYTWNYVNSYSMLNYIESIMGNKKYKNLDSNSRGYYLKLVNKKN